MSEIIAPLLRQKDKRKGSVFLLLDVSMLPSGGVKWSYGNGWFGHPENCIWREMAHLNMSQNNWVEAVISLWECLKLCPVSNHKFGQNISGSGLCFTVTCWWMWTHLETHVLASQPNDGIPARKQTRFRVAVPSFFGNLSFVLHNKFFS